MALTYHVGDELPAWTATVTIDDVAPNLSSGYTYSLQLKQGTGTAVLTKTTNISGSSAGVVTVAWADGDLAQTAGTYRAVLTVTRTSDSAEWTIEDRLILLGS
jgi:hypothetical protein